MNLLLIVELTSALAIFIAGSCLWGRWARKENLCPSESLIPANPWNLS